MVVLSMLGLEFRLRIGLVVAGIEQLEKKIVGRGVFVILPNPFFSFFPVATPLKPNISLSPLCSSSSSSYSPSNTRPKKLEFEQIFSTHSCKFYPFGIPHELASIWCEIQAKLRRTHHIFGGFEHEFKSSNTCKISAMQSNC